MLGSISIVGGPGTGAGFLVTSIVPSGNVAIQTDKIEYVANVAINTDPSFGAFGNVSPLISTELSTSNVDSNMSDALPTANSLYGVINTIENAIVDPSYVDGSIAAASVDDKLITTYNSSNRYTLINRSRANTFNATASGNVTGIIDIPGRYLDTRGWLSSNKVLQDNFFYQEFSYEIVSNQVINSYS